MSSKDDPGTVLDIPDNLEELSFDDWCELHRSDPQRFESCRLKILNDLIDSAPAASQPRLRGLMFRMEGESRRSKSRLGYNLRLSNMMMEMLDELRTQIHLLCEGEISDLESRVVHPDSAEVLPFRVADRKSERDQ